MMGHSRGQIDPPTDPRLLLHDERQQAQDSTQRSLLQSAMQRSPPQPQHNNNNSNRSSTLPPVSKVTRPRKSSVTQNARRPRHERKTSKDAGARRMSVDRKAMSAEPSSLDYGKRWADLIDAAASANEEDSRDMTPVSFPCVCFFLSNLCGLRRPIQCGMKDVLRWAACLSVDGSEACSSRI
jgi:hypothetical protein